MRQFHPPFVAIAILLAISVGCGNKEVIAPPGVVERSLQMVTLPSPIEITRENEAAWEPFKEKGSNLDAFRVRASAGEQVLRVKYRDLDNSERTQRLLMMPGGYYVPSGDGVTIRPRD